MKKLALVLMALATSVSASAATMKIACGKGAAQALETSNPDLSEYYFEGELKGGVMPLPSFKMIVKEKGVVKYTHSPRYSFARASWEAQTGNHITIETKYEYKREKPRVQLTWNRCDDIDTSVATIRFGRPDSYTFPEPAHNFCVCLLTR